MFGQSVNNAWANSWLGNLLTMVGQKMVGTIGNRVWAAGQFVDTDWADGWLVGQRIDNGWAHYGQASCS